MTAAPETPESADSTVLADIRRFYLAPERDYSLDELARLWRMPLDDVREIFAEAIAASQSPDSGSFRVRWDDAVGAARAFHVFRHFDVEVALGNDLARVRGHHWRTIPVLIHLPEWVVDTLRRVPFVCHTDSVAELAERVLCESAEAELVLRQGEPHTR